ncbi:MAG: CBS domain-containing protein, partial [Cyanobacteria bacterium]|nr:CBS domain-containing protein [Cyanobacteriota bacterium]
MSDKAIREMAYTSLHDEWSELETEDKLRRFTELSHADAEEFFREIGAEDESELLLAMSPRDQQVWIRVLDPDDAADVVQEMDEEERPKFLELLKEPARAEVTALLAYAEDVAGGLMNPRYSRVRPDMTVGEALAYVRKQALEHVETIYFVYVIDPQNHLLGIVSLRKLISKPGDAKISDVMRTNVITVTEETDQEELSQLFAEHNLLAIPVVDEQGLMKGIVTIDDIVDVVEEEATEDIQKMGGSEALGSPYVKIALSQMIKKRVGWLV